MEEENDKLNEKKMEAEAELLWDIVQLLLEKERALHGTSPGAGKEAGVASLNKQMEAHKQIKSPLTEEVIEEFSKLYMVKIKAKKKPEPVPEIPKEEPNKVLEMGGLSSNARVGDARLFNMRICWPRTMMGTTMVLVEAPRT